MLKWGIYTLLLCNIAFITWHYRSLESLLVEEKIWVVDDEAQGLVLLGEKKAMESQKPVPKSARLCYNLGPFEDREQAIRAQELTKQAGFTTSIRREKDMSRDGFWVLLPPTEHRADALATIARLKENKIRDYFLVARREYQNAISLGVFSLRESANRRIRQIQEIGFNPVVEEVKLARQLFWLEWPKTVKPALQDSLRQELDSKYNNLQQVERSCK